MVALILWGGFTLFTLILGLLVYARWNRGTLEKMGLNVPETHFLFGNTHLTFKTPVGFWDVENFKKLGSIYGIYEGREAHVYVCDPDLIRIITTRDAHHFIEKRRRDFRNPVLNEFLDVQPYEKWKIIRSWLSKLSSISKTHKMCDVLNTNMAEYAEKLKQEVYSSPGKRLEDYDLRNNLIAILINTLAYHYFSLNTDIVRDKVFPDLNMKLVDSVFGLPHLVEKLSWTFPHFAYLVPSFFMRSNTDLISKLLLDLMEKRRKDGDVRDDAIDLFNEIYGKLDTPELKELKISEHTIVNLAVSLFFGNDQISSVVSIMVYYALNNPEVERKLYEEVDSVLKRNGGIVTNENLTEFVYVRACVLESTRLRPFSARVTRVCTKDWECKEFKLSFKQGTTVQIPVYAVNWHPDYFKDPENYNPDRFLPENKEQLHPFAYASFGYGAKGCTAQHFSIQVMVMQAVHLLRHFKFHLRKDSKPEYFAAGPNYMRHKRFAFDVTLRENETEG